MDRLQTCVDALRVLARSKAPDRAVLVEIDAYLLTETDSSVSVLESLRKAIRAAEAKGRKRQDWSVAIDYVRSLYP